MEICVGRYKTACLVTCSLKTYFFLFRRGLLLLLHEYASFVKFMPCQIECMRHYGFSERPGELLDAASDILINLIINRTAMSKSWISASVSSGSVPGRKGSGSEGVRFQNLRVPAAKSPHRRTQLGAGGSPRASRICATTFTELKPGAPASAASELAGLTSLLRQHRVPSPVGGPHAASHGACAVSVRPSVGFPVKYYGACTWLLLPDKKGTRKKC